MAHVRAKPNGDARVLAFPFSSRPPDHVHDGGYLRIYRRLFGPKGDATLGTDRRMIGAWIEMLCAATWEPSGRDVRIGGAWFRLEYGQLVINYRVWAKRWAIPKATFYAACMRMAASNRIVLDTHILTVGKINKVTIVTIRNFGLYQRGIDPEAVVRPVSYAEYLQSPEWQAQRRRALKRAKNRCQICNSPRRLEVHHRTYERLGNERPDDLIVLSDDCHELFHAHGKLA